MDRALDIIRDITFILIALETFAVLFLLIVLSRQVLRLIRVLREGILPILDDAQAAARTTRATAEFMGEHVVKPTAGVQGKVAGLRRAWRVLFGDVSPPGRSNS